jgi:hypothetical protein
VYKSVTSGTWGTIPVGCFERQSRGGPRINAFLQRERKLNAAPLPVWELDWQDCPVAFSLQSLARHVISVKIPLVFPPSDMPISTPSGQHWFIVHREDAAKVLLLKQEVQEQTERYLETACAWTRLQARYDWDAVVMDSGVTLHEEGQRV